MFCVLVCLCVRFVCAVLYSVLDLCCFVCLLVCVFCLRCLCFLFVVVLCVGLYLEFRFCLFLPLFLICVFV